MNAPFKKKKKSVMIQMKKTDYMFSLWGLFGI